MMSTTVSTDTRAPRRQAPRPADPRRAAPRRDGPRRDDPRRDDPRRDDPRRDDPRRDDPRRVGLRREGLRPEDLRRVGLRREDLRPEDLRRDEVRPGIRRRPISRRAARPADGGSRPRQAVRAARQARDGAPPASRTPFILLVLAILGCGLVCLLVINTTLAAASFRISNLQEENTQAAQRVQELQQQVSTDQSASSIEQRALGLGMRPQPTLNFIDLRTGRRYSDPAHAPGAIPGYTP
jgi:hypothetical protein